MAPSTSSRPPKRVLFGWPLAFLLFLSHSVLETLQCSSSGSHSQHKPTIVNIPRRNAENPDYENMVAESVSGSEAGEIFRPVETSPLSPGFYFSRNTRDSETIQACSRRLNDLLNGICNGNFYEPNVYGVRGSGSTQTRSAARKRSVIQRRVPRTVVHQCCLKSCRRTDLLPYCRVQDNVNADVQTESYDEVIDIEPTATEQPTASIVVVEPEPEPVNSLFVGFLQYLVNHLNRNNPRTANSVLQERELPTPEARVQVHPDIASREPPPPPQNYFAAATTANQNYFQSPNQNSPTHHSQNSGRHEETTAAGHGHGHNRPHGTGLNAVTSTMPPVVFPIPRRTNDYRNY